ncbi:MAG: tyrosine-type recombinase/integrase [Symbiobacteriia bacterium]
MRLTKKDGWLTIQSGKRSKWREVPLNGTVRDALAEYMRGLGEGASHLFPGRNGGRLTERALRLIVARYAQAAGVPDVSPHDLRHRFGYRMAASGTPLQVLASLMGHDSLDTTMIYAKATQGDLQAAVERIAWR